LVVNDTRVIPARLLARRRQTGGSLQLLLVEPISDERWIALAKPGRRARPGTVFDLDADLHFTVVEKLVGGKIVAEFSQPIEPHLDRLGHVPLPPYIHRPDQPRDREDYQTVYARQPGAIAAPTAGLHFTTELIDSLESAGVSSTAITLHVGIGTFRPVTAREAEDHQMEAERFEVSAATAAAIERTRAEGGRIVAVGTTVVRTLESVSLRLGAIEPTTGSTDLFIRPGFRFGAVDLLLTNFHLPQSTLLMLVCAFAGRQPVLAAYWEAIASGYRFYSYGDCMLIDRARSL
jgi:S-adenosylmethionine:tRNA ribosyltransferase-isomerase